MAAGAQGTDADFSDQVRSWGVGVVDSYLETRGRNDYARSVKSLIEDTAGEYGGRFFVELLQNAHDAHPADALGGKVLMLLDETEGLHGTVYAADGGSGFMHDNFRAISNLALSNKPVGEGIGNRGVGFKSVLQVCESPEIYSCDPRDRVHDGFCFRFADLDDLRALTKSDEEFGHVREDVSRYTVPVPIHAVPHSVRTLRCDGYSTVLRLPLRSKIAATEAAKRFDQLRAAELPVVLFLTRITGVTLIRRTAKGIVTQNLERHPTPVSLGAHAPHAELVTVGEGQTFLVLSRDVNRKRLSAALREAVQAERLKEKWLAWDAPAHVALAIPYGWDDDDCRLYTYLPMGDDAQSPLHAHLHAPFFTDFARKGMEWDHPLNSMLLDTTAELAADAACALVGPEAAAGLPEADRRIKAAVDLISWTPARAGHLPTDTVDRRALPGLGGTAISMRDAWLWPEDRWDVLTADLAQKTATVSVLAPGLGKARLDRLRETMEALGEEIDLPAARLADTVEAMTERCFTDGMSYTDWDKLYDDLACMFDDAQSARALAGRRLLLADDGTLRECALLSTAATGAAGESPLGERSSTGRGKNRGGARRTGRPVAGAAFFQPVRQRTDDEDEVDPDVDLDLPASLRSRLFFLHPGLNWHDENRQPTRARELLRSNRLVRKFDARSLVDHVRAVLANSTSRRTHRDAMRFLFNLQRSRPSTALGLDDTNLRVPTAVGGLIRVSTALFSSKWPATRGADLQAVALAPPDTAPELAALHSRLLPDPDKFLRHTDDRAAWVVFLQRLGVLDALPVQRVRDTRALTGNRLRSQNLAATPNVPGNIAADWSAGIPANISAYYPETPYKTAGSVTWLPGQDAFDHLPAAIKTAYARLLAASLNTWSEDYVSMVWERDRSGFKDPQSIPTPLSVFVTDGRWLTVHDPSTKQDTLTTPRDAWHFLAETDAEPPRFVPLLSRTMRAILDASPTTVRRLRDAGMGVWNSASDADRLTCHLAGLLNKQRVDRAFLPQLSNAYRKAWMVALQQTSSSRPTRDDCLIVRTGAELGTVFMSQIDSTRPVVVTDDSDDAFLRRIATEFQMPVLHLDAQADLARDRIVAQSPGGAVRPEALGVQIQIDGADFTPSTTYPAIVDVLPWLRPLLTVIMEHRTLPHERPGEARMRQLTERLGQLRLAPAHTVTVRIADEVRPTPPRMRGVLPVPHPKQPTLAIEIDDSAHMTWTHLDAAAEPLMQLVGYPRMATEFKLALSRLQQARLQPDQHIDSTDLADACEVDRDAAKETLAHIGSGLQATLQRLHPVVVHLWGPAAAAPYAVPSAITTDEELDHAVVATAAAAGVPADDAHSLLAAARAAEDLDTLRRGFDIPLADINAVLAAEDPPHPLIDYAPQHAEAFDLAVLAHAAALHDRLRWVHLELHRQTKVIPNWPVLRDLTTLKAPAAWSHTRDHVNDSEHLAEAERQLASRLGKRLPSEGPALQPLAALRTRNRSTAEATLLAVTPTVHAWCRKNHAEVPGPLAEPSDVRPALDLLDEAGALDFRTLDLPNVLAWAYAVGAWPSDMLLTADLDELGLTPADLEAVQSEEDKARQRKQQERRTVAVDGTPVDVGTGFAALRDLLQESLDSDPGFLRTPARNSRLGPAPATGGRRAGERPSSSSGLTRRASELQLNAIGFAGEWLAYHWLLERYPDRVTEACWKSKNRAAAFTGDLGDDDLGYDFVLPSKGGPIMYEVKATTSDGGEIQLGESEVLTAQANSRNNRWRLLVVTSVLTKDRQIRQLRNPFHPDSRGQYTFAGQGLRLLYRIG